jgi:hypothetical protein
VSQLVNKLATNPLPIYLVDKLLEQHCHNLLKLSQLVNKLATNRFPIYLVDKLLEQHCHNLLTSLLQSLLRTHLGDKLLE